MKYIINKLSALIMMLMCVSATVQAEIVHHTECDPTPTSCGFKCECWEDTNTGKYYKDAACTEELDDFELVDNVLYQKRPESPIVATSSFDPNEYKIDWGVVLNWAGVTTYSSGESTAPRWIDFKASTTKSNYTISNARLVCSNDIMYDDKYIVKVYVNDIVKYYKELDYNSIGIFVLPLPNLKNDDIVRFEVTQSVSELDGPTVFMACLEYNEIPCTHEYATGSAICSICGYMKPHTHTYNPVHECTQCGYFDESSIFMSGDLGGNIKWRLYNDWTLHYYGTGEMESFNIEHNAWKKTYREDVKKVVIGEGITKIGDASNHGYELTSYFGFMSYLTEAILPSTLKSIGKCVFEYSSLSIVTLPEGLETIGDDAFRTTKLENIVIPASVTTLGQQAFGNCPFLKSVTLMGAPTSIGQYAFYNLEKLKDFYLMSDEEMDVMYKAFVNNSTDKIKNATLHVNNDIYHWALKTSPWNKFAAVVPLHDFCIEYTDANNNQGGKYFDTEASGNTWTLTDGAFKNLTINEDIPMQKLTYTRNFPEANKWQALYVPFEMEFSDWADKFDVAAINNFHEYTNNGVTEKIDLEVRYVKKGKLRANTPYLIRAKAAGEQTIVLNDVTLMATESKSIDCSSTERKYTFTGTYDAINNLKTNGYIFLSGGSLSKSNNDTDVLKPMRWYLTIEDYFCVTGNAAPALAKPISINVIGEDEATGIEDITVVSSSVDSKASGIYSITGTKLDKPQRGINIINGKKIVVK